MGEKYKRKIRSVVLDFCCKREDFLVTDVVHAHHHVYTYDSIEEFTCLGGSLHPYELRRITQIQVRIFPVYLSFNLSVFLENECIVITAYHKNLSDPVIDQRFIIGFIKFLKQNRFYIIHIVISTVFCGIPPPL